MKARIEPRLRECDYGRWGGRTLSDIVADEPSAANSWLNDPAVAPHGGEPIVDVIERVAKWLAAQQADDRQSIVVTHPTIIRAAIVHIMNAPPQSFWRIDIRPLSFTRLSGRDGRWNVTSSGCAVTGALSHEPLGSKGPSARNEPPTPHEPPARRVTRALEAGATGYVFKDTSSEDLMKAFAAVQNGTPYLSHALALKAALVRTPARRNHLVELRPRELQVLSLLADGRSYSRIAQELTISYKTVVNVSYRLKQKLDARSLSDLIRIAVKLLSATN